MQAATKPQRGEKGTGRPATLQANSNSLARSSSILSSRHAVKAADSDSDEPAPGRSLLTTAAGSASQRSRQQPHVPKAEARPAAAAAAAARAAASSDSDDDLLHAAHTKQSQLLSSKHLSQSRAAADTKTTGRSVHPASVHPRHGAPSTSLPRGLERTTSKESASSGKAVPQSLLSQASLQRSMAAAGSSKAARQKPAAAQTKAAAPSDGDSDEERWAGIITKAAQPRTQVQVLVFMLQLSWGGHALHGDFEVDLLPACPCALISPQGKD